MVYYREVEAILPEVGVAGIGTVEVVIESRLVMGTNTPSNRAADRLFETIGSTENPQSYGKPRTFVTRGAWIPVMIGPSTSLTATEATTDTPIRNGRLSAMNREEPVTLRLPLPHLVRKVRHLHRPLL